MAVEIAPGNSAFGVGTPQALFTVRSDTAMLTAYASSADGKRFLISTSSAGNTQATPLTVVVNWLAGVKK